MVINLMPTWHDDKSGRTNIGFILKSGSLVDAMTLILTKSFILGAEIIKKR